MLAESQLYTFLDRKHNVLIHFFEGQKLIQELILTHNIKGNGFSYFRDLVLSFQPMITLLRPHEGFGVYIDSEDPYFRWKIETNWNGQMRTLMVPEDIDITPSEINGVCRFTKIPPGNKRPYTSFIELKKTPFDQVVNNVLTKSFQMNCKIKTSKTSDQSLMILDLPNENVDKQSLKTKISLNEYILLINKDIQKIFQAGFSEGEKIIHAFESLEISFINKREILFNCPCSKERMLLTLNNLWKNNQKNFFKKDEKMIEMKCDYCKKHFCFSKEEIIQ